MVYNSFLGPETLLRIIIIRVKIARAVNAHWLQPVGHVRHVDVSALESTLSRIGVFCCMDCGHRNHLLHNPQKYQTHTRVL
jgi:hypothetical protein